MKPDKKTLLIPILLITLGGGWLLTTLGVAPGIDWAWTLGLAVAGILTFVLGGIDKVSVVIGPFLLAASCLSILHQTGRLTLDVEVPIMVILAGVLLLLVHVPTIPAPRWMTPNAKSRSAAED